jgi:hypothetical protein
MTASTSGSKRTHSSDASLLFVSTGLVLLSSTLGGGVTNLALGVVWLAQACLGSYVLKVLLPPNFAVRGALMIVGPGYLVGFLLTTWMFMLMRGGVIGHVAVYLLLALSVFATARDIRRSSRQFASSASLASVLFALVFAAMSWEFPELLVSAIGLFVVASAMSFWSRNRSLRNCTLVGGFFLFFFGLGLRGEFWYLESDDLANRMAEGVMSVSRGFVASVGSYPFDRYHWVSPVASALQADLARADPLFVFTVFGPLTSLLMMAASLGVLVETFTKKNSLPRVLLVFGTAFFLLWRVQIDTEATVARLAMLAALLCLARVIQLGLRDSHRVKAVVLRTLATSTLLGLMLYLFRPDLVVFMLLLLVGVVVSQVKMGPVLRIVVLAACSAIAIVAGLLALRFLLPVVSDSGLSYATLLVDWRPEDLGPCLRPSFVQEARCMVALEVDFWAPVGIAALFIVWKVFRSREKSNELIDVLQLLLPALLSYPAFRFTLTSDFPSSVVGFWQIGLFSGFVMALLVLTIISSGHREIRQLLIYTAVLLAGVHLAIRGALHAINEGIVPQLGWLRLFIVTPINQWLIASMFALGVAYVLGKLAFGRVWNQFLAGTLAALLIVAVWNISLTRPTSTDVIPDLIANAVGPPDVDELGEWFLQNTSSSALLATNYQCRPNQFDRCKKMEPRLQEHPRATANWMLMTRSRREFLYLSQPFYNPFEFKQLHDMSIWPGTALKPDFSELKALGVSYYIAFRDCTKPESWRAMQQLAVLETENFLVVQLGSEETTLSSTDT